MLYSSRLPEFDRETGISRESRESGSLRFQGNMVPIYGKYLDFSKSSPALPPETEILSEYAYRTRRQNRPVTRIGYDLAGEIKHLLTVGQPASLAAVPTLELHIHLLRCLILSQGLPLVEIPPIPRGASSITCLTHDVDFVRITDHKFDRTMLGFLHRATIGSAIDLFEGRSSFRKLLGNWLAALSLPAVFLGLRRDFFNNFPKYLEIEGNLASTFFLIPFRDRPGKPVDEKGSINRSVKYDISDIAEEVKTLTAAGCEIGLHGIDAWNEKKQAAAEIRRIEDFSGMPVQGIRMHWLFFGKETPGVLAEAGFTYDSTLGYNDAAGFRCGTAQVFRFPETENLSELPLIIQDTALFYPDRMGLDENQAEKIVKNLVRTIETFGGAVTINWHQRSLGPERQWGDFYQRILEYLESRGSLFMTAGDAVSWFRSRRSAGFEKIEVIGNIIRIKLKPGGKSSSPGLKLRIYRPLEGLDHKEIFSNDPFSYIEMDIGNESEIDIQL